MLASALASALARIADLADFGSQVHAEEAAQRGADDEGQRGRGLPEDHEPRQLLGGHHVRQVGLAREEEKKPRESSPREVPPTKNTSTGDLRKGGAETKK